MKDYKLETQVCLSRATRVAMNDEADGDFEKDILEVGRLVQEWSRVDSEFGRSYLEMALSLPALEAAYLGFASVAVQAA